jgi:hypothetical protein
MYRELSRNPNRVSPLCELTSQRKERTHPFIM